MSAANEPIVAIKPADLIFFWDEKSRDKSEKHNQIGVVIDEGLVLYSNTRVRSKRLIDILNEGSLSAYQSDFSDAVRLGAIQFFRNNQTNRMLFDSGIRHLVQRNTFPFIEQSLFPKRPVYADDDEYNSAWEAFISNLRFGDILFTADQKSPISRVISAFTHGPWSHTATYLGDGQIQEMVTSGRRRCSLDIYRTRSRWVAGYRTAKTLRTFPEPELFRNELDKQMGYPARYAYKKVVYYGLRSFLGDHSHNWIPNSLIYSGRFFFAVQV